MSTETFTLKCIARAADHSRWDCNVCDGSVFEMEHRHKMLLYKMITFFEAELKDELIELGFDPETIVFSVRTMVNP